MGRFLDQIPLAALLIATLILGLAPFVPQPHLWEKLVLLTQGNLNRPVDILDLIFHAAPAMLLALKLVRRART